MDLLCRIKAVEDGHVYVEDDEVRLKEFTLIDGLLAISGLPADPPPILILQQNSDRAPNLLMIINY